MTERIIKHGLAPEIYYWLQTFPKLEPEWQTLLKVHFRTVNTAQYYGHKLLLELHKATI